ncbi:MAG TPA: hypothetical protein VFR58_07630 [Flavisolibacter sp.]|nr:hypothetical protein [Flavisolibacter sp.]
MKPLLVLSGVFILALFLIRLVRGSYEPALAGRIAMSAMLIFTAIAHFAFTEGMAMMLPPFTPQKVLIVQATGVVELAAALGLLLPQARVPVAWALIAFFIIILPANIYAAFKQVNYQKASFDGNGPIYLWFRIPLQALFIVWTYLSSIKGG